MLLEKQCASRFLQCTLSADDDFCDELAMMLYSEYGEGFWKLSTHCIQGFVRSFLMNTHAPVATFASGRVLSARAMLVHDLITTPDLRVGVSQSEDELAPLSPLIAYRGGKVSLLEIQVSYVLRHCKIDAPLWRGWEGDGPAAMADIVSIGDILRGPNGKNGPRILPLQLRSDGGVIPPML
jgi:hypothetical protein